MLETLLLRTILPMLIAASLASYATHKITVNSYEADELTVTKNAIKEKDVVDEKINDVEKSAEVVKEIQYKDREVVRIKYETIIKTEPVYINTVCALPANGVSTINDNVKTINNRREPTNKVSGTTNIH